MDTLLPTTSSETKEGLYIRSVSSESGYISDPCEVDGDTYQYGSDSYSSEEDLRSRCIGPTCFHTGSALCKGLCRCCDKVLSTAERSKRLQSDPESRDKCRYRYCYNLAMKSYGGLCTECFTILNTAAKERSHRLALTGHFSDKDQATGYYRSDPNMTWSKYYKTEPKATQALRRHKKTTRKKRPLRLSLPVSPLESEEVWSNINQRGASSSDLTWISDFSVPSSNRVDNRAVETQGNNDVLLSVTKDNDVLMPSQSSGLTKIVGLSKNTVRHTVDDPIDEGEMPSGLDLGGGDYDEIPLRSLYYHSDRSKSELSNQPHILQHNVFTFDDEQHESVSLSNYFSNLHLPEDHVTKANLSKERIESGYVSVFEGSTSLHPSDSMQECPPLYHRSTCLSSRDDEVFGTSESTEDTTDGRGVVCQPSDSLSVYEVTESISSDLTEQRVDSILDG